MAAFIVEVRKVLTFFTTAKPFRGRTGIIQRNALKSWTLLDSNVEVILFGDDEGAAEVALELGIRHEPHVQRNEYGSKRLDYMFATARTIARHDILCYVNCDIILMDDFCGALDRVRAAQSKFLMVGQRWDVDIHRPWDFTSSYWQVRLRSVVLSRGQQRPPEWIDYFAFTKGLYGSTLPPFVVGRVYWDNWLVWRALNLGAVVNASECVMAVHQNHDYSYHIQGKLGVWNDTESQANLRWAGGYKHLRTIHCAPLRLTHSRIAPNYSSHIVPYLLAAKRLGAKSATGTLAFLQSHFWHPFLDFTRPIRHRVGIRQARIPAFWRRARHLLGE